MSRWYLTSDATADRTAHQICTKAGLHLSGDLSIPGSFYLRTYRKRAIQTAANVHRVSVDNCAWVAGTLILPGEANSGALLGADALPACYQLFIEGGIARLQEEAIGHFAIGIKTQHQITISTDALGAFSLYYSIRGSEWFISNSLSLSAEAFSACSIDSTKLLIQVLQTNLPGEDTFYTNIKRLFGTQQIRIDLRDRSSHVESIPPRKQLNWDLPTIEAALDQYTPEIRRVYGAIAGVGPVGLFGTGGLDSRTVLSALLDRGAQVRLMYGTGNSRLTDYHSRDLELAEQVAQLCGVPFQKLDWSGSQPHTRQTLAHLFTTYGFQSEIYGSPQGVLDSFNGGIQPYPAVMVGGYSPALTNAKPWEREETSIPLQTLVSDTMHFQGGDVMTSPCIQNKCAYEMTVRQGIQTALALHGIQYPESGASLRTFVKAKLLLYVRAEARFLNFVNEFGYYVAPFMVKRLYEPLLEMPFQFRKGDEFQLRLIKRLKPDLVKLPLYSGIHTGAINQESLQFVRDKPAQAHSGWKQAVRNAMPPIVRAGVKGVIRKLRQPPQPTQDSRDVIITRQYSRMVMEDPLGKVWFSATNDFSPKDLARISQYLVGVNTLGYNRNSEQDATTTRSH